MLRKNSLAYLPFSLLHRTILRVRKHQRYDVKYDDGAIELNVDRKLLKPTKTSQNTSLQHMQDLADKENETPLGKRSSRTRSKTKRKPAKKVAGESEYGDLNSLRAAILNKTTSGKRKKGFENFVKKWTKNS